MEVNFNYKEYQAEIKSILKKVDKADKRVQEKCIEIVTALTDRVEEESVLRCPIDEGFLEKSHQKRVVKSPHNPVGYVYIPANAPASDYALYMHEWVYKLGRRSIEKQATVSVEVGRKFLERALSENERPFALYVIKELRELIGD